MSLNRIKSLLDTYGLSAKKSLGQNFLVDDVALDAIVTAADLSDYDRVIEVGPGTGFLTEKLVEKVAHVTAVEFDKGMVEVLKDRFKATGNVSIVHSDALNYRIEERGDYKVVANIPYYITSPLLKHFLQTENRPRLMVLLVQKEVAEKIVGKTGKSLITIESQIFGRPEIITYVPSSSFYPEPKVDSAVIKIEVYDEPLVPVDQIRDFLRIVKFGFSMKRKKLTNALAAGLHMKNHEIADILKSAGINPEVRAEVLTIEDWKNLLKLKNVS